MPDPRRLKLDLFALLLLALTTFLSLALFTYSPADPPTALVYPANESVQNACGRAGAMIASLILEGLGVGAYYLVASLATLAVLVIVRKPIDQPFIRAAGWAMSLVGLTTLAALALPGISPGPVIGAGGYLGAAGRELLQMHLATAGALVLILSVIVGGLLLCTDYILFRLTALALARPARGMGRVVARLHHAYNHGLKSSSAKSGPIRKRKSDVDEAEDELLSESESTVAVKIGGKKNEQPPADEEEEEEDVAEEEEEETEEEAEEAAPAKSVTSKIASALRIRGPNRSADERQTMMAQLDAADRSSEEPGDYELPPIDLLMPGEDIEFEAQEKDVRRKAKILEKTFANFGFNVKVVEIETGPVIAQFEVELEAGLRLSKITSLADDLAIALRVPSVRIVAPIPGKNTVGIEVPNAERQLVRLREVIEEANGKAEKMKIPIFLGKDVAGNPMVADLASLPHLLIAGRTGTGKSVCLNTIIVSMLMTRRPDEVRMLMIDPKMVELSPYKTLPHLMHPVVTDMRKAEAILAWAVEKMEERYSLLARAGVRHISSYNALGEEELMERLQPETDEERAAIPTNLPYIVIVADEMADLMMTAAKEVETHIIRLAQKSRAVGIHLVLATQKPTVDVITGLIKSNLPARIAFQVASRTDSRVVLDEMGADKLLGNGDMLFLWPGTSTLIRGQGTYVSDDEINRIVDCVGTSEPEFVKELVQLKPAGAEEGSKDFKSRDELYEAAIDCIVREGRGSVSLLQRALGVGYGRGARLIDFMAEDGIVGPYNGSQAREVLITLEQWEAMRGQPSTPAPPTPAAKKPRNKIVPVKEELEEEEEELVDETDEEEEDYEDADEEWAESA